MINIQHWLKNNPSVPFSLSILLLLIAGLIQAEPVPLKLLSWNVYFDDESGVKRYPEIVKTIASGRYDVICIQEATGRFIRQLGDDGILSQYSIINGDHPSRYKNIILAAKKPSASGVIALPTHMDRHAPFIIIKQDNFDITIVNVHLDSMQDDTGLRIQQIDTIMEKTRQDNNVVLCGDFNFGDREEENSYIKTYFIDVGEKDSAPTYDVENNVLAAKTAFLFEQPRRLDRIMTRGRIQADDYQCHVLPYSDHYPISSRLVPATQPRPGE